MSRVLSQPRHKRLLLGWLALVAPLPLPFNAILSWPYLATYLLAVAYFLRRASRDPGSWLPVWAMNLLAVAYLPFFGFDLLVLSRGRLVVAVTHLLLFTVVVKLFALRRERDKWQTALAVFFLFLVSMATSTHPTVVIYLVLFLAMAFHLFARFAQLHLAGGFGATEAQQEELLGVPLRGVLTFSVLTTLLVAVPLFAVLPRVRAPFLTAPGSGNTGTLGSATGFSDEVTLDTIGSIRTSREVAMRLSYDGPPPPGHEMRFKAGAFDVYDDGVWRPRPGNPQSLPWRDGTLVLEPRAEPVTSLQVFLRPVTGQNLPLPSEAARVEIDRMVFVDDTGVARVRALAVDVHEYRVGLAGGPVPLAPPVEEGPRRDLLLDTTGLSERVRDLADRVAGPGDDAFRARAIEAHLIGEYEYSLEYVGRAGADPLEDFLFERREGHCEYFATAMVMMLRAEGIPARLATGFLGAEYNPLEGYFIVRQANAHAWVEAWLPERGWVTFDPTPASGRPTVDRPSFQAFLSQAWDYVIFRWDRYVLTFGFGDQMRIFASLRDLWSGLWSSFGDDGGGAEPAVETVTVADGPATEGDGEAEGGLPWWAWLIAVLLVAALAAALWRWRSGRRLDAAGAYRRLRTSAGRAGLEIHDADAPLAFGRRLGERFPAAAGPGGSVVALYVRERFAGRPLDEADRARLGELLGEAEDVLRKAG